MDREPRAAAHLRVGLLWRGPQGSERPPEDRGLQPLLEELGELGAEVVPIPFGEDRIDEARAPLSDLDALLTWVNPIQDGVDRRAVDELARAAAAEGVFVSAHPAVIRAMGTKEVLFRTRELGWGSDTTLYRSVDELLERLPARLAEHGRLVVKQGRGNGGNGVWRVELVAADAPVTLGSPVLVREARSDLSEQMTLGEFALRCAPYFSWSEVIVDQEYQPRLGEGLVRCYFSHDRVVGFCHQFPKGLLDAGPIEPAAPRARPAMVGPDTSAYQPLRQQAERSWVPGMLRLLGLEASALPVIWDADFLYGPKGKDGEDRYVLCEINVSAVWPFPPMAAPTIAANVVARARERSER